MAIPPHAVPLPGAVPAAPSNGEPAFAFGEDWLEDSASPVPLPGSPGAIPLPGAPAAAPEHAPEPALDFDSPGFWEDAPESPSADNVQADLGATEPSEPPPDNSLPSFDFEIPPDAPAAETPAWANDALPDLPTPAEPQQGDDLSASPDFDFSNLPNPATAETDGIDLSNLPSPSDPGAPPDDVTLDLSGLPQEQADSAEPQAAEENFFASGAHPGQGLETLSFDDDAEAGPAPTSKPSAAPPPAGSAAEMDRLRRLYEGRMAVVSVVHSETIGSRFKKRIPILIGAAGALVVLLIGLGMGATRYGPFGIRKILLPRISSGSPHFGKLQEAKRALLVDTLQGYQTVRDRTAEILKIKEYPEARAVWCQAIFYLQRHYSAATSQEVSRANSALDGIELLGTKHPEVVKARGGSALALFRADPALIEAAARPQSWDDEEMQLLLAESLAVKNQGRQAIDVLNKVVAKNHKSAKAFHALGNLYQGLKQVDKAIAAYQSALEADPNHLSSAVELAALNLLVPKDASAGVESVHRALEKGSELVLSSAELAKAHALNGVALVAQNQAQEAIAQFDQALKIDPGSTFAAAHLASLLLSQRDYEKSASLFKDVVAREPTNFDYADGYLSALIGLRKVDEALIAVTQASAKFPTSARIAYQYGRIEDALGDKAQAERHYKHAINSDPKFVDAMVHLSRFYLRHQRVPDAKAQLEQAVATAAEDPKVHAAVGELALAEGDPAKAKTEFEKAVSGDPRLPDGYFGLAELTYSEGAFEEALKYSDQALALDPYLRDGRLQRAMALWKLKKLDQALEELKKAKTQEPKSAKVAIVTGAVLLDKGDLPSAESVLFEAVSLDSYTPESHFYLARARDLRGDNVHAIDSMKNALERDPKNPAYHYEMGVIYRDAKNISEALEEWKKTVELSPTHADALQAIGEVYSGRGDFETAVSYLQKAIEADPSRSRVEVLIGDCYFNSSKWDQALSHYTTALKSDSPPKSIYYKIGRTFTEKGKHASSVDWYKKAIEADQKDAMAYYYLGYAFKDRHRRKEAVGAFQEYLALKPDAQDKKDIEDEIYDLKHE